MKAFIGWNISSTGIAIPNAFGGKGFKCSFLRLTGLMVLQAHSKINYLKDTIWKYTIKYSTRHHVLVFSAWQVKVPSTYSSGISSVLPLRFVCVAFHGLVTDCDWPFFLFGLGLLLQGHLLSAIDFVYHHSDCFLDVVLLSTVSALHAHILVLNRP